MPMQHSDDSTTRYNVKITDKALADMEAIYQYISEELKSPASAIRQYNRIADGILSLDMFPERIRIMESNDERLRDYRRLLVDNYSVFFVINDMDVIVFRVIYSATDLESGCCMRAANMTLTVRDSMKKS